MRKHGCNAWGGAAVMQRRWLVAMAGVAALAGCGAVAYQFLPDPVTGPFAEVLPGYLQQLERARAGTTPTGIANFRAKVVVVDMATRRVDAIQAKLPMPMRAAHPSEVGTLIGMVCGTQDVGGYNDGRKAVESVCRAWVIDVADHRPVGQFTFVNPPAGLNAGRPPPRPDSQLVDYLKELRMR